jgi:predicted ATPase
MKLREIRLDGYKNISECRIPVRDFNVVVGPNNSGKSNLLEVFRTLWGLCFGPTEERQSFFHGGPFSFRDPRWFGLMHPTDKALSIGITLETEVDQEPWNVEFDLTVRRSFAKEEGESCGFQTEVLRAKQPSKTGPAKTYLHRTGKTLTIGTKTLDIPADTSALSALPVLYPEAKGLSPELTTFLNDVHAVSKTTTYALSPEALRQHLADETASWEPRVPGFGLLPAMDEIFSAKDKGKWALFKETVMDILDLEGIQLIAHDRSVPDAKGEGRGNARKYRTRLCLITRKGDYSLIEEYSDGTLIVIALLAALILRDRKSGPTCIEELENCLHPMAQEKLLRFLQSNASRWQTIVTTHSPYLVNGVDPDNLLVAVVDEQGYSRFQKPADRKAINELLKSGYMSFGDLMADNFKDVLKE